MQYLLQISRQSLFRVCSISNAVYYISKSLVSRLYLLEDYLRFLKNNIIELSILDINLLPKVFILLNLHGIALLFAHRLCTVFPTTLD